MSDLPCFSPAGAAAVPLHLVKASGVAALLAGIDPALAAQARLADFRGEPGRPLVLIGAGGTPAAALIGLGDGSNPLMLGAGARDFPPLDYALAAVPSDLDPTQAMIGWGLGAYGFHRYKAKRRDKARLVAVPGADFAEVDRVVRAVWRVRDMVNTPAQDMGPAAIEAEAEAVAGELGARFETIVGDDLLTQNFPMIHAVGRAAAEPPRLVRISFGPPSGPRLALVGKGVSFDSGGLDLKPSAGMRIMKKDMGGAAHALALGEMVGRAGLNLACDVWLAVVENAVSASAFRPGDVLKSRKGLTVEVDNTDAEGRLILGDALTRASEERPDLILDYATLTGAARTALGPDLPPMMTDHEELAEAFLTASRTVHDPLWRLPLWSAYDAEMDSPIADLKNTGDAAFAGAIYGGLFLRRFVGTAGHTPAWAHFDVYAWQPKDKPGKPAGGEAHALRASWEVLKARFG
jgi:leucyl aminopeptidase